MKLYAYMYTVNIRIISKQRSFVGTMGGELKPMDYETDSDEEIDVHENGLENDTKSSRYNTYVSTQVTVVEMLMKCDTSQSCLHVLYAVFFR